MGQDVIVFFKCSERNQSYAMVSAQVGCPQQSEGLGSGGEQTSGMGLRYNVQASKGLPV